MAFRSAYASKQTPVNMQLLLIAICFLLSGTNALYYDGLSSYSIYPRLDVQICHNSSFSFDFTISTSLNQYALNNRTYHRSTASPKSPRLLVFSEQQIQKGDSSKRNFMIKLVNDNKLVVRDYWSTNDLIINLPADYKTSWFRFVYTRSSSIADVSLYKFEPQNNKAPKLTRVYSKQTVYSNYFEKSHASDSSYSQLLVGGIDENLFEKSHALHGIGNFHGYIMNLQYTSDYSSQCGHNDVCLQSEGQRHYAIYSSSSSKKYKLKQSLMIDDICESDTLIHDMCPKDCSCLSNNFEAPYFSCDCKSDIDSSLLESEASCNLMAKSFEINFDDPAYFSTQADNFEYPLLPTFSTVSVQNVGTQFNSISGMEFHTPGAHIDMDPVEDEQTIDADSACFWNIDNCLNGFVQHMIMSIDELDESKFSQKVMIIINGHESQGSNTKFVTYIHNNRLHFSIYEDGKDVEWLVSSPELTDRNYKKRPLKVTLTWVRNKSFSLHFDGFLIDMVTNALTTPVNSDIYAAKNNLNKHSYEFGIKLLTTNVFGYRKSQLDFAIASSLMNHQFTIKYLRRDYYNDNLDYEVSNGAQESKIIVSSPLPSEIIRIDNTQRVMYKIDSPLTGVTMETIDLAFKTRHSDGVVFYITNNPIVSYFELVDGLPVAVIDTRFKNVNLRPVTSPRLDDNRWHEVKLHREGNKISITIDSQFFDTKDLGTGYNQILTGGHVYLGIADPSNINLSHKKPFDGEMVRGKVTINNVQQKVEQRPYDFTGNTGWYGGSSSSAISSSISSTQNQTVNILPSRFVTQDGKQFNIYINVYGQPGFSVNGGSTNQQLETPDTHYIYLDKLPNTQFVSVAHSDREIDFHVGASRLDRFLIKFQTRQECGQLVTLINTRNNFVGLELYNGYVYSSTSHNGKISRNQISRVRVDDGRIYQVNMKQEQDKLLCWLDADDSYKSSILFYEPISVNTVRVAGRDGQDYGFSSPFSFVGCIGAVILNDRDVIDLNYQYVPAERKESCQKVIEVPQQVVTTNPPPTTPETYTPAPPVRPPSLGYISFAGHQDILTFNFFYDHEKPNFDDISFIFRTVNPYGILFSAHNDDNQRPNMIGAYLKDGKVHVVYVNSTSSHGSQDYHFDHIRVDDGSLYRLNIRRNSNGQGFIQLQSYESVKALPFQTEPGKIKLTKILVGGADQWSRNRFFATRPDFIGCIIDLFQINGNSVIKPAEIPKQRYNCQIDMKNRPTQPPVVDKRPKCLAADSPVSFSRISDAITSKHDTARCKTIHIPFRTRTPRGILYSHSSNDGRFFIVVHLKQGYVNLIVRDSTSIEKNIELNARVDDGKLHKVDIYCENGFLIAYVDRDRGSDSKRIDLESPLYFNTYTIGYFNSQLLSSKFSRLDKFQGCLEQVLFNNDCLLHDSISRIRMSCDVQPAVSVVTQPPVQKTSCQNHCSDGRCVIELNKDSHVMYLAREVGAYASAESAEHDLVRLTFKVIDTDLEEQELVTVFNYDRSIRVYLENGLPVVEFRGQKHKKFNGRFNDDKWHSLSLEKKGSNLIIKLDEYEAAVMVPFVFNLYGDGRIFFGSTVGVNSYFRGLLKDVFVKYSNVEYDIIALMKDQRMPGVTCSGNVFVRNDESAVADISSKDSNSIWRFRGVNSGDLGFVPYLQEANKAELSFLFNTSMSNGNIMCTKDDTLALNTELVNSVLAVRITDIRTRRVLQTANCRPKPGTRFNDNNMHKVQIIKNGVNQFQLVCDDQQPVSLNFRQRRGEDVPFVSTKYGVSFGVGCFEQDRRFAGDLTQVVYVHDGHRQTFDDLQYSEDPRFSYEGYVEFRPEFITQVYSDPKPISLRSKLSSAKITQWDSSKVGRLSFEFKQEITDDNGFLFSTESHGTYFAIVINDGYLESILSPHRFPNADSSTNVKFYDRFQRLFHLPQTKINDGLWHRIDFSMVDDSIGSFVLDNDLNTKIKFPVDYWNEESSLVFGNNLDIERDFKLTDLIGSFRGCIRNVLVNSRLIDWSDKGSLVNVEAGCYNSKFPPSVIQTSDSAVADFNGNGCIRYSAPPTNGRFENKEVLEFIFKTSGDKMVVFDSFGGEFFIHLQGPSIVIRNKADTSSRIVMERGISFNDGNYHKMKISKEDNTVDLLLDDKYKVNFKLRSARGRLTDFYIGCARDRRLKVKLIELKDFVGSIQDIVYTANGQSNNLIEIMNGANSPLVDGNVKWTLDDVKKNHVSSNSVMFKDAKSFLKLENLNFDIGSSIKFLFKSNEPNGLIGLMSPSTPYYSSSSNSRNLVIPNYMAVEMIDGIPSLLINFGNNDIKRINCGSQKLNDNNWHSIEIKRDRLGTPSTEQAPETHTITFSCDNSFSRIKVDELQKFPFTMFTAGNVTGNSEMNLPNELWLSKNSKFFGCIGDFEVSGTRIAMFRETSPDSRKTLVDGCRHDTVAQCSTLFRCMNQGECIEGFSRAYCNCDTVSYTGDRCEVAAATLTFNGSQGLEYSLVQLNRISSEDISLRFKTPLRNGLLFALKKFENDPSVSVSLEDGRIKVVYGRDINDKVIYLGEPDLFSNNKWHTVNVKRFGQNVHVSVVDDEKNHYYASDDLDDDFEYVTYRFIEIGSISSKSLSQEHPNFIGWIQNVRFNGDELLNYYVNDETGSPGAIEGTAQIGENGLLMHHQLTFTEECPVTVTTNARSSEKFNVRLYFKTSNPDGVLFIQQGKGGRFMALELNRGILRFVFNVGGGIRVIESSMSLNDKNWHEVTLKKFDRQKFTMKIDEFRELLVDSGTSNPQLSGLESCTVGGINPSQRYANNGLSNKGFMGCLSSLEFNHEPVDLYSSELSMCTSVQRGCVDSVCSPNPCSNNGVCEIANNQVSCDCSMTSYSGPLCRDDSEFYFFGGDDANAKKCGLVKYTLDVNKINKEEDNLSFGFTTTVADALLTRIESENGEQFVEIKLIGGLIALEININGVLEKKDYLPSIGKQFNDNRYYVVQFKRNRNAVTFRIDNFDQLQYDLKGNGAGIFHSSYVYAGSSQENGNFLYCYYGVMSGMILNGHSILDVGIKTGSVVTVDSKYVVEPEKTNTSRWISLTPDGYCPLGYNKSNYLCIFVGCPLYSDFLGDYTCRCYYSFYHTSNGINECRKINETVVKPVLQYNNKFIPAKAMVAETPLGLILGIISGVGLALLAAAIGARKCADGLCIPAKRAPAAIPLVQTNTVTSNSESMMMNRRQEQVVPLIQNEQYRSEEQYARDTMDYMRAAPYQQVTEVTEMYEQTMGPNGTTVVTSVLPTQVATYNMGSTSHMHSTSHRNLAMDSLLYAGNNSAEYELANVTCVTMTPNGKYAIIGQSNGTPQVWDTFTGQLIRSMSGQCANCTNLTLACNNTLLVGLASDGIDIHTQSLQVWELVTGKPILMTHQIKCCVFALSADTNSIFMAGNQRFGRGISVGILDLVSNQLTKEIKSDPSISFGDNPESIVITPDERHAVVGCRSLSGTNFIVFDITKATEIAQTRSIALDADPKCITCLNNTEMVTGTRGGHLIQWNIHSCVPSFNFEDPNDMQAHRNSINKISISSDHEFLVTASNDCTAKVWSTRSKQLVSILSGHHAEVTSASISNTDLVITGSNDQTVNLWRLHNGSQISSMAVNMNVIEANMAKHNQTIVAIGEKDNEQQLLMLRVVSVQR